MSKNPRPILSIALVLTLMLAGAALAHGQYKVIFRFPGGAGGDDPYPVISDAAGNLYGVTQFGGVSSGDGWGTVYKLSPGSGGSWNETVLYSFTGGADGGSPEAALTMDAAGNLYGTTQAGGLFDCEQYCGVVFEVSPNGDGTWSEKVLHSFTGTDGTYPGVLIPAGRSGFYGITGQGGNSGKGTVFQMSSTGVVTTLYSFTGGSDGSNPGGLIEDSSGNLFGTTYSGGASGNGTIFELSPNGHGGWTETVLYSFTGGADGDGPQRGIALDQQNRTLYGSTSGGGDPNCNAPYGCGTVFALSY